MNGKVTKDKTFWRSSLIFLGVALLLMLTSSYFFDLSFYYREYSVISLLSMLLAYNIFGFERDRYSFYDTEDYKDLYLKFRPEDVNFDGLFLPYKMTMVWAWINIISSLSGALLLIYGVKLLGLYLVCLGILLNIYAIYFLITTKKVKK